jgi:hypothetical protein
MKMMNKYEVRSASIVLLLSALLISACSEEEATVPTYEITDRSFEIKVFAFGEIEAAEAQRIPSPGNQPMTLEWLAPENTIVQKAM